MSEELLTLHSIWGDCHNAADKVAEAIDEWKKGGQPFSRYYQLEALDRLGVATKKLNQLLEPPSQTGEAL